MCVFIDVFFSARIKYFRKSTPTIPFTPRRQQPHVRFEYATKVKDDPCYTLRYPLLQRGSHDWIIAKHTFEQRLFGLFRLVSIFSIAVNISHPSSAITMSIRLGPQNVREHALGYHMIWQHFLIFLLSFCAILSLARLGTRTYASRLPLPKELCPCVCAEICRTSMERSGEHSENTTDEYVRISIMLPSAPPLPDYLPVSCAISNHAAPRRTYKKDDPE